MSSLVISLDFELFWGVAESRTLANYRNNVEGEWIAIPQILSLFRQYDIHATWATVGMLMCKDYAQWRAIRPSVMPGYVRNQVSTYDREADARDHPNLFFARPLVKQIQETPGQEIGSHSYSHFYCAEEGATPEQFAADLACGREIAHELGIELRSFVFPRNQVREGFLSQLPKAGMRAYRGTPQHWVYRHGHFVPAGLFGRAIRMADTWLPIAGAHVSKVESNDGLANVPGGLFLRPWSRRSAALEPLRLKRITRCMSVAAATNSLCHIWWHPHNFGVNLAKNIEVLESVLMHFVHLRDRFGMRSQTMFEAAQTTNRPALNEKRPHTAS
jgi:peptidoglycan/xylan/chitin deacetylase (PgdA/CDA1 family)